MLGGADNPNGELPSYITGADTFPQKSRAAWTGHHCRMWGLNKGRVVSFARCHG